MNTARPFFVLRASIGTARFNHRLRRREDGPRTASLNGLTEWRLPAICMGAGENIQAVDAGARNRGERYAFRLRCDVICTKYVREFLCLRREHDPGSSHSTVGTRAIEQRHTPRRKLELECQHLFGSPGIQRVPRKRQWRPLHEAKFVDRFRYELHRQCRAVRSDLLLCRDGDELR